MHTRLQTPHIGPCARVHARSHQFCACQAREVAAATSAAPPPPPPEAARTAQLKRRAPHLSHSSPPPQLLQGDSGEGRVGGALRAVLHVGAQVWPTPHTQGLPPRAGAGAVRLVWTRSRRQELGKGRRPRGTLTDTVPGTSADRSRLPEAPHKLGPADPRGRISAWTGSRLSSQTQPRRPALSPACSEPTFRRSSPPAPHPRPPPSRPLPQRPATVSAALRAARLAPAARAPPAQPGPRSPSSDRRRRGSRHRSLPSQLPRPARAHWPGRAAPLRRRPIRAQNYPLAPGGEGPRRAVAREGYLPLRRDRPSHAPVARPPAAWGPRNPSRAKPRSFGGAWRVQVLTSPPNPLSPNRLDLAGARAHQPPPPPRGGGRG